MALFYLSICVLKHLESHGKVPHQWSFPLDGHSVIDLFSAVIHILHSGGNDVHVIVGIHTARYAQPHQVEPAKAVLVCHRVTVGQDIPYLTSTNACLEIQLARESLRREFLFWHAVEHLIAVDKYCMPACWTLVWYPIFIELGSQMCHLMDAGVEHVELGVLVKTLGNGIQVSAVQAAIGDIPFKRNAELHCAVVPLLVVGGNETAHVHNGIFLARHGGCIGLGIHLAHDFFNLWFFAQNYLTELLMDRLFVVLGWERFWHFVAITLFRSTRRITPASATICLLRLIRTLPCLRSLIFLVLHALVVPLHRYFGKQYQVRH